jgi:diphosphomevalonate decarboxylase
VAWNAGSAADGHDSRAELVADAAHWPDMRAVILVASAARKTVPSTEGMQATVKTSTLFKVRAAEVVPARMVEMRKAIAERDFEGFAKTTMKDSNSFHATCLDTDPPIFYMNDTSRAAVRAVELINAKAGKSVAAYTFDAGPNAVIYYLAENESAVAGVFKNVLSGVDGWQSERGGKITANGDQVVDGNVAAILKEGVSRVILTGVGEGPQKTQQHLVDDKGNAVNA